MKLFGKYLSPENYVLLGALKLNKEALIVILESVGCRDGRLVQLQSQAVGEGPITTVLLEGGDDPRQIQLLSYSGGMLSDIHYS